MHNMTVVNKLKKRARGLRAASAALLASFFLSGVPSSAAELAAPASLPRLHVPGFALAPNWTAAGLQASQPIELPEAAAVAAFPAPPQPNEEPPSADAWFEHVGGVLQSSLADARSAAPPAASESLESQYDGRRPTEQAVLGVQVLDRAGKEWRLTKVKAEPVAGTMPKGPLVMRVTPRFAGGKLAPSFFILKEVPRLKGAILERYRNGDRVSSLLRYQSPDSITALEYGFDYKPGASRPGTPAKRMAIFWLQNGRLQIHLSLNAGGLLDPRRELRAAAAQFGPRMEGLDARLSPGAFRRLIARGLSPEQAALRGWLGRFAAESGFTKIAFAPGALESLRSEDGEAPVLVSFTRPD